MSKIHFPSVEPWADSPRQLLGSRGLAQTAEYTLPRPRSNNSFPFKKKKTGMDDAVQSRKGVQVYQSIRSIRKPGFWVLFFRAS